MLHKHEQINDDGKAFDGNWRAVGVAVALIVAPIIWMIAKVVFSIATITFFAIIGLLA